MINIIHEYPVFCVILALFTGTFLGLLIAGLCLTAGPEPTLAKENGGGL